MPSANAHTTRAAGLTLTANIYNADHENHITNVNAIWTVMDQTLKVLGGVGSGTVDDTAAVTLASALPHTFVPPGIYDTTLAREDIIGPLWGGGQVRDSANKLAGPWYSNIKSAPSPREAFNLVDWYSGDIAGVQIAMEHRVTGVDTLGHPASGYDEVLEASAEVSQIYLDSGHIEHTGATGGDGRTAIFQKKIGMHHNGLGDLVGIGFTGIATNTVTGSTHVLANPNLFMMTGQLLAGASGVLLGGAEWVFSDEGFDTAVVGHLVKISRSVDTSAKHEYVQGFRVSDHTGATKPIDAYYTGAGRVRVGIDLTGATTATEAVRNKAAIALVGNDRIYLNATAAAGVTGGRPFLTPAAGSDYVAYDTASSQILMVRGGNPTLQVSNTSVTAAGDLAVAGDATVSGTVITSALNLFGLTVGLTSGIGGGPFRYLRVSG